MEHSLAALPVILFIIIFFDQGIGVQSSEASSRKQIPAVEVDALLEFKANYISKGSQHMLWTWNSSSTLLVCESWAGITCATSTGVHHNIHGIDLSRFGLAGSLAPHLGNLSFLSTLDLSTNSFTGSIPWQLQGCTSLTVLNLNNNSLTGAIPSSLSSLSSLVVLRLCNNSLTGHIPPAILSNCTSLEILSLCHNALTGSIPANLCLHLPNLQFLLLWNNNLTGAIPPSLGNCTSLVGCDVSTNPLGGPIPPEFGLLSHLNSLLLGENSLTGTIPPSLGNCTSLMDFEVFSNVQLTGAIPSELGQLRHLQRILLGGNSLTGAIPSSLRNCTSLVVFHVGTNQLTGPVPPELGQLRNLTKLLLVGNLLSGMLPSSLSNCTGLLELALNTNQLRGPIFRFKFSNLQALQLLDLGNNHFTSEIPWHSIANCIRLYYLDFSQNHLSGGFPSILGKLLRLDYLYLNNNLLQGGIPDSADYTALTLLDVDLSFNRLNGSLPSSLAHALSTIAISLNMSHNQLSGSLPIWLGQLVQAQAIDLSNNNFVGSIPDSLGNCANLAALNLSEDHLSGDLPWQLGSIAQLQTLDLSNNNFSGALPSYLGTKLHHLQFLDVSFNNLTGPIPTDDGVFRHLNASSFLGNPGLCGPILKRGCIDLHHHHHHSAAGWQLRKWRGILLIALTLPSIAVVIVLLVLVRWRYCLRYRGNATYKVEVMDKIAGARRFSAQELVEATQGYSEDNLLGQGGLSVVYKGVLADGMIVAVKQMKDVYNVGGHEAILISEMQILSKLRHRNLVQVLGCVLNLDVQALVLEYMANGSLEQYYQNRHLHEEIEHSCIGLSYWEMMTQVALSIAKALAYLHHEYGVPIIHGDVKPSNILLDSDMEPRLADFGLAKMIGQGAEAVSLSSGFKGSIGYMAPEYALAARISTKVDVYAYGVVLLGMLTGRRPTEIVPAGLSLHEWVKSKVPSDDDGYCNIASIELKEVLDASLLRSIRLSSNESSTYNSQHSLVRLLRMGLACTMDNPNDRPSIKQVLAFLTSTPLRYDNLII